MTSKKQKGETTVSKVARTPSGLFADRLEGKDVEYKSVTFHLEPIKASVINYIETKARDNHGRLDQSRLHRMYAQFGITKVSKSGEEYDLGDFWLTVDIMGRPHRYLSAELFDEINPDVVRVLEANVIRLTHLSDEERRKLDFFTVLGIPDSQADAKSVPLNSENPETGDALE